MATCELSKLGIEEKLERKFDFVSFGGIVIDWRINMIDEKNETFVFRGFEVGIFAENGNCVFQVWWFGLNISCTRFILTWGPFKMKYRNVICYYFYGENWQPCLYWRSCENLLMNIKSRNCMENLINNCDDNSTYGSYHHRGIDCTRISNVDRYDNAIGYVSTQYTRTPSINRQLRIKAAPRR